MSNPAPTIKKKKEKKVSEQRELLARKQRRKEWLDSKNNFETKEEWHESWSDNRKTIVINVPYPYKEYVKKSDR